jgi:hypothetical protein
VKALRKNKMVDFAVQAVYNISNSITTETTSCLKKPQYLQTYILV